MTTSFNFPSLTETGAAGAVQRVGSVACKVDDHGEVKP
jgi:hypothetical protein